MIDSEQIDFLGGLNNFPVYMGCTNNDHANDEYMDLNFHIDRITGTIQVSPVPSLQLVYQHSHGSCSVGKVWDLHRLSLCEFTNKYNPGSVFEIGGGTGTISKTYMDRFGEVKWTIIEPNPSPVEGCRSTFIQGFFDDRFVLDNEVDMIFHSHVFEHAINPDAFLKKIASLLGLGKKMIFSVPNMCEMLKRCYSNCLNFEHATLLSEEYIEYLLSKNGFAIIAKQYFLEDHSIFYATVREDNCKSMPLPSDLYERNKQALLTYLIHCSLVVDRLNQQIKAAPTPHLYLFGAHVFSQVLINQGLDTSNIISILDNDPNKIGKRLYGTNLTVQAPAVLADKQNPIVILQTANYTNEIKADILTNINNTTCFLE